MSKKWHSGPPPSVGWWIADHLGGSGCIRWWNGKAWSVWATQWDTARQAEMCAIHEAPYSIQPLIKWQHRPASWPERSKT